ncbi:MAG: lactate racemase domain-containing protein [Gemmataceae bacterium]
MSTPFEYRLGPANWLVTVPVEKSIAISFPGNQTQPQSTGAQSQVEQSLEAPFGFEPMRRAMTPDDHVVIVVDDELPRLAELLSGVIGHIQSAGVQPDAVTLLLAPEARNQGFIDDLPDEWADVKVEVHNPDDEKRHAYLATTTAGRRVYLNRTLVEAEFTILLTGRRFDPVLGMTGAANAIFPAFSNTATRNEFQGRPPVENPFAVATERTEAEEVAWLLGTPFLVQVIEGAGDSVQAVVSGLMNCDTEGVRVQRTCWTATAERRADLVIACAQGGEAALANALANAGRIVAPHGRIVLLADVPPFFGEAFETLKRSPDVVAAVKSIIREKAAGTAAAVLWAFAARAAKLIVGPNWNAKLAEELFATSLGRETDLAQLIAAASSVAVLADAHKLYITVPSS